MALNIS